MSPSSADQAAARWDEKYAAATRSAWVQNPIVEHEVYDRMTGERGFWLSWVFEKKIKRKINRLLAIGCGDGSHELGIARNRYAREIHAFDASPVAIQMAQDAAKAEGLPIRFSVRRFEEFVAEPPGELFDAVLFSGSLHHVTDIEGMLATVRRVLRPGGLVIVNEYVGPVYNLYPKSQVDLVNRVLDATPPIFRLGPDVRLVLPTIEAIMANDPTEGVRAPLIPTLVRMYFTPEYERHVGGGLLHPIFDCLNASKVNDGSLESATYISMLIALENEFTANGLLKSDFLFGLYVRD